MLNKPSGVDALVRQTEPSSSALAAAVKKLLMWKEEPVRIATVQCVTCLVTGHQARVCADTLLGDDVAGSLYQHKFTVSNENVGNSPISKAKIETPASATRTPKHLQCSFVHYHLL